MHKCSKDAFVMVVNCREGRKIYGATIDKIGRNLYSLIWAFKLNPQQAKNEGFGTSKVNGQLTLDSEYPGCPYCGSKQLVFCGCGAVMCYNGERVVTCPKCGCTSEVSSASSVDMHGGAI